MRTLLVIVLSALLGLSACGGGGTSPPSTGLTVSPAGIKTLALRWEPVGGATHYELFEDLDGAAGPQAETPLAQVPAGQVAFQLEDVFLPERVNAVYRLQACNSGGCTDVASAGIAGIDGAIGYFKASNPAAGDDFGQSLALSADGQWLAVGAPYEDGTNTGIDSVSVRGPETANYGAVYVFRRGPAGWMQDAYIKPATAVALGQFGFAVALAQHAEGLTLLVGAPFDSSAGAGVGTQPDTSAVVPESGAAYVFDRDTQGRWTQTALLKATPPVAYSRFGKSVSLSADGAWAAVGHPSAAMGNRASVFRRLPGGWSFWQDLRGSNTESGDDFGETVQLDREGETLVVGAWNEDGSGPTPGLDNSVNGAGAVYVFKRDNSDQWQEQAYLKAPVPRVNGYFGYPVTLSSKGETIAVSEPGDNTSTTPTTGRVYVFRQQGAGWHLETSLSSPLPTASGDFGERLALSADGSALAISNILEDSSGTGLTTAPVLDPSANNTGTVYLYRRDANGGWAPPIPVKASNSRNNVYFGWGLALSANGNTLAVNSGDHSIASGIGGDQEDASASGAGAVYLY